MVGHAMYSIGQNTNERFAAKIQEGFVETHPAALASCQNDGAYVGFTHEKKVGQKSVKDQG
jgi:hypothetical protein